MKIADARDRAALFVRAVKEQTVHRGEELDSFVSCWRGTEPVALLAVAGGRDQLIKALHLAAVGFGADVIGLSNDTVVATELRHPETGKHWEPGQISEYAAAHPGKARQFTKEMVLTLVTNRAGDSTHVMQAYETFPSPLIKGRTEIRWVDWQPPEGKLELGGVLPEMIRDVMQEPTIDVVLTRHGYPVGAESNWRDRADLATVESARHQFNDGEVHIMLFAEGGTERQQLFNSRLGPGQVVEPPDIGG